MPVDHKLRLIRAHLDNDQFLSRSTKIRAYDSILKDAWNKLSFIYRGRMSMQMIVHWPKPFLGSNLESNILNFFGKHNEHAGLQGIITVGLFSSKKLAGKWGKRCEVILVLFILLQFYSLFLTSGTVHLRGDSAAKSWARAWEAGVQAIMRYVQSCHSSNVPAIRYNQW